MGIPKVVLLDRDGVLNRKPTLARYVRTPEEFEWMTGAAEAVARLNAAGYIVLVITNQAGVARGIMSREAVDQIHDRIRRDLKAVNGRIDAFYVCPHAPDAGCACRKPKPGLILQAQAEHGFDLTKTLFIGDDPRDEQAAQSAGCLFDKARDVSQLRRIVDHLV